MDRSDAIEEAAFLVRSPHRIRILETLAEGPATRGELTERTDVSRVTLGRSLGAMEERKWLARADGRYHLRPLGELVLSATDGFLETLTTQDRLRDVVDGLPTSDLGFGLGRLGDATVLLASRHDSGAVVRRYVARIEAATELRVLKDTVDMNAVRTVSDRIAAGRLDATVVYSTAAIQTTLKIPEARELMVRDIENGKRALRYDGKLTHHLAIIDGTVLLFLLDDHGVQGVVETDDPSVHEWATTTFETIAEDSEELDADVFRVGG